MENPAIINSIGASYSFKKLNEGIEKLTNQLAFIKPNLIAICNKDEFHTMVAVYAAFETQTSFFLLPGGIGDMEYNTKMGMSDPDLIISDYITDNFYMSLNLKSDKLTFGTEFLKIADGRKISKITGGLEAVKYGEIGKVKYKSNKNPTVICFHRGINSRGYKTSTFSFEQVTRGYLNAAKLYSHDSHVVYYESLDLTYDLINGALAPLSKRCTVRFLADDIVPIKSKGEHITMYTNSFMLNYRAELMMKNCPFIWNMFEVTRNAWLKSQFKKVLGTYRDFDLILSNKILNRKLINALSRKITTLYTMCEIASFVAHKKYNRIRSEYSVGKPTLYTKVEVRQNNQWHGIASVKSNELCVAVNNINITEVDTMDIVKYNRKGELIIVSKLSLITHDFYGRPIKTALYLDFVLNKREVKNAQFFAHNSRLILAVQPDVEYLKVKNITISGFIEYCKSLQHEVNAKLSNEVGDNSMVFISPYLLKEGLNVDTYKIFARGD